MKERMLRGERYIADDPELAADHARAQELLERYNATRHTEQDERDRLLRQLLGEVGDGVVVKPPFRCDYGSQISIGARTFVNYGCVILDVVPVRIGAHCQIATNVQLLAATHPADHDRGQRLARRRRDRLSRRDDRRRHGGRRGRGGHARPAVAGRRGREPGTSAPADRRLTWRSLDGWHSAG
jgi:hypothetical protein